MPTTTHQPLPYWYVNVPEGERTDECPEFLRDISPKDRAIISTPDEQYHLDKWPDVRHKIANNRLAEFQRRPSELRRYLGYCWQLRRDYGSILNFILAHRLHWSAPIVPRGRPFEFDEDIRILRNDWPYGVDSRIVHLVVWAKFELVDDSDTDDLSTQARAEIEEFVQGKFGAYLPQDRIAWFKNWSSIKSVHAVEHFHVMLFDPDPDMVRQVTGNDDVTISQQDENQQAARRRIYQ